MHVAGTASNENSELKALRTADRREVVCRHGRSLGNSFGHEIKAVVQERKSVLTNFGPGEGPRLQRVDIVIRTGNGSR